jgi:hypothetical protein
MSGVVQALNASMLREPDIENDGITIEFWITQRTGGEKMITSEWSNLIAFGTTDDLTGRDLCDENQAFGIIYVEVPPCTMKQHHHVSNRRIICSCFFFFFFFFFFFAENRHLLLLLQVIIVVLCCCCSSSSLTTTDYYYYSNASKVEELGGVDWKGTLARFRRNA